MLFHNDDLLSNLLIVAEQLSTIRGNLSASEFIQLPIVCKHTRTLECPSFEPISATGNRHIQDVPRLVWLQVIIPGAIAAEVIYKRTSKSNSQRLWSDV